jgi:hypothetical protein
MRMKKFMNFIGDGVGEKFLHEIRRVNTTANFWYVCENYLAHDEPMTLEPVTISETALNLPAAF